MKVEITVSCNPKQKHIPYWELKEFLEVLHNAKLQGTHSFVVKIKLGETIIV
jgi:hypothetical protein